MKLWLITFCFLVGAATVNTHINAETVFLNNNGVPKKFISLDRIKADHAAISQYREGLRKTLLFVKSRPDLFPNQKLKEKRLPDKEQKKIILDTWAQLLDYMLALDSIGKLYKTYYLAPDKYYRTQSFLASYAAFLAQYRYALDFIDIVENDPGLDVILNEAIPELGLQSGMYGKFKYRFLNVVRGTEFLAMNTVFSTFRNVQSTMLIPTIKSDVDRIWEFGKGRGELLTYKNAINIVKKSSANVWFPVQAGVAEWMGDSKVARIGKSLITQTQIDSLQKKLHPGDILLERREWYLSNIGLPGYWPHAALYIGDEKQREHYFNDAQVNRWVLEQGIASGKFNDLLNHKFPKSYQKSLQPQEENHVPRVIEAISEGVSFTTLEHSADADSVAALRPELTKLEKAIAIYRSFIHHGKPYDFNFDFLSDASLVCTELIFKAYEPTNGYRGLQLPLVELVGRKVTTANEIARLFDEENGKEQKQFKLISFIDGNERKRNARESSIEEFRKSWKRPKWHILVQDI